MSAALHVESIQSAATVAIVVHGVGDHSRDSILERALAGVTASGLEGVSTRTIDNLAIHTSAGDDDVSALEITAGSERHLLVPLLWSRLRPRAAKEADFFRANLYSRLLGALLVFLPSARDALRCIPAAPDFARRALVTLTALLYALLAPALVIAGVYFLIQMSLARAAADSFQYVWWRAPVLVLGVWLFQPVVTRVLMVLDFVGDVVAYVGNARRRVRAEDRLIAFLQDVARRAPHAQLLLVGHSLGSVLVTHCALRLRDATFEGRLHLVTMGSPLRMMAWFFPANVHSPSQLAAAFESRKIVSSWANFWRDSDAIGRALQPSQSPLFVERSLGDGGHSAYWADPRAWAAVINYLRAASTQSLPVLARDWPSDRMSDAEERELQSRASVAAFMAFLNIAIVAIPVWIWSQVRDLNWLASLGTWNRWVILSLTSAMTVLTAVYYIFTSRRVGGDGASRREMLARYRRWWRLAMGCGKAAAWIAILTGLLWWASQP